jgi:2-dehydropantoate 2-reductase
VAGESELRVGIMGAGAVGCFLGGRLAADQVSVVFVGRERLKKELEAHGLALADLGGDAPRLVAPERVVFSTEPAALADCDLVLCCVKSAQTEESGRELSRVMKSGAIVVSMQNGVRNAELLRAQLPAQTVLGGIVGFNVVSKGSGAFRRATSGPLVVEGSRDPRVLRLVTALAKAGFEVELVSDLRPLQWSKLVMNLNNAVSALSDRPTKELIFAEGYRRILARVMEEAIGVLRAAHQPTARLVPLPVRFFPFVLRLPSLLLRIVASAQVKIDPEARSSMWEDLSRGRATEVEQLNGEIVRLAASCGAKAPLNARMVALVHEAEQRGAGSPKLGADELWSRLTAPG